MYEDRLNIKNYKTMICSTNIKKQSVMQSRRISSKRWHMKKRLILDSDAPAYVEIDTWTFSSIWTGFLISLEITSLNYICSGWFILELINQNRKCFCLKTLLIKMRTQNKIATNIRRTLFNLRNSYLPFELLLKWVQTLLHHGQLY